jgi:glutamate-1-semialdehyde 2,1-aminomutase
LIGGDSESTDAVQRKVHIGAGVPRAVDEIMTVLPYGHPAAFDLIRRRRNELAAVMVEAVRGNDPHLDAGSWLQELGAVCRASGVLLILDEVTTGFRLAYGGAQEYFGLRPEMVAYGKAVGGGLPLGVVAGRSDIMRVFSAEAGPRGIFSASTFAGNPLSIAAGLAALKFADMHRDTLYPALEASAVHLAATFSAAAADLGVPARLQHAGSMLRVVLGTVQPRNSAAAAALRQAEDAFATHLLNGGVLMQTGLRGFLAAAHDAAQIDLAATAFTAALAELKTDGLFAPITAP